MSRILDLGDKLEKLPILLDEYERGMEDVDDHLSIEGKLLEHANREQAAWQSYYDQRKIELYTLVKFMEAQVRKVRGKLFIGYTENHSHDLSDRAKDRYIDQEPSYLNKYELLLEVEELHKKYEAIVDSFRSRGFALNNITKIRVAALEDVTI